MAESLLNRNNLPETDPPNKKPSLLSQAFASEFQNQRNIGSYQTKQLLRPTAMPLTMDDRATSRYLGKPVGIDIYNQDTQQYLAGLYQPTGARVGNFFGTLAVNIAGEAFQAANSFNPINNEAISESIHEGKQHLIRELFPTFTSESYAEGDLSFVDKLGRAEFWNNDMNETIAFMAGSFFTGYGAAALKLGSRVSRYGVKLASAAQKNSRRAKLGNALNKFGQSGNVDNVISFAAQTHYEASSEANMLSLELKEYYDPLIRSGQISREEATERIRQATQGAYLANAALLTIPNMVNTSMINKARRIFTKTPKATDPNINRLKKNIFDDNLNLVSDPLTISKGKTIGQGLVGFGKGTFSEGTQEVLQSSIGNIYTALGKSSDITETGLFDQLNFITEDIARNLSSDEYQEAFLLGALIGGVSNGLTEAGSYIKDIRNSEKLRSNLQDQYKAGADIINTVARKDENGKIKYRKDGSINLDPKKVAEMMQVQSMQLMDNIAIQDALDQGDYAKAERLFLSRVIAPLVYNHVSFENGKDLFMRNVGLLLEQTQGTPIEDKLPTQYAKGLEGYYDLVAEQYEFMATEGNEIITDNINKIDYDKQMSGFLGVFFNRAQSESLEKAERKELNKKKGEFAENAKYAFTVLGARKKQTEKIIEDLQGKIETETRRYALLVESDPGVAEEYKKNADRYKELEKKQRRELKYLNSEYAKLTSVDWYKSAFKKYLKDYSDLYYRDQKADEVSYNKQMFIDEVARKNYKFKQESATPTNLPFVNQKSDYQNLNETVVFKKNNEFYIGKLNGNNQFVITKLNKDFKFDPKLTTNVDWLMFEDETFFDGAEILEASEARNFMQNIDIRNLHLSYQEAAQELFENNETALQDKIKQFEETSNKIQEIQKQISQVKQKLKELAVAKTDADEDKIAETEALKKQVVELENSVKNLEQDLQVIKEELNTAVALRDQYSEIVNAIEEYMNEIADIEYDKLTEEFPREDIIDRDVIIARYFSRPEVREMFGEDVDIPINTKELNAFSVLINKYRKQKVSTAKVISAGFDTTIEAKTYIVSTIVKNLRNNVNAFLDLRNKRRRNQLTYNKMIQEFPAELQMLLQEVNEVDFDSEFDDLIRNRITENIEAYDSLLDDENIIKLNQQIELDILRKARKLSNIPSDQPQRLDKDPELKKVIDALKKSLTDLTVVDKYRDTYKIARDKLDKAVEANQKVIDDILGDSTAEVFDYVGDFKDALELLRATTYNIYRSLSADDYVVTDQNTTRSYAREQDESTEEESELYRLRKDSPYTTINGVIQIDTKTNSIKRDKDNQPILRDNPDSIRFNDYINEVNSEDLATGDYVLRYVNADQLEGLFQQANKKAPYEGPRENALYSVVYYKGEPVNYNGEIVFTGIAETGTYFKEGNNTTLDKEAIIRSVFKKKGKDEYNIYTYDGVDYDLSNQDDIDAAAPIAVAIKKEEYNTWRDELVANLASDMEQYGAITYMNSGLPINEFTQNPDTGEFSRKFKNVEDVIKDGQEVIISKTGVYRSNGVVQRVLPGVPYVRNSKGQLVRVYREKIGNDEAYKETIIKLLGFLGTTRNIKDRLTIGKSSFSVLPVGKESGLINQFINWGKKGIGNDGSKHLDIWITGKLPQDRVVRFNLNGRVHAVKLTDLVTVTSSGFATVNKGSASVQALMQFLALKTKNVDVNALESKRYEKFYSIPNNVNYREKKVTVREKYKNYQDYILKTSKTSIVGESSIYPQFVNRYFGFSADINSVFSSADKVPNYRKKSRKQQKQSSVQNQDPIVTADKVATQNPAGTSTGFAKGDTVINFRETPKGRLQFSFSTDPKSTMFFDFDLTNIRNPQVSVDVNSPALASNQKEVYEERVGVMKEITNMIAKLAVQQLTSYNLAEMDLKEFADEVLQDNGLQNPTLHDLINTSLFAEEGTIIQSDVYYKWTPESIRSAPQDAAAENDTDTNNDIECADGSGSKGSSKPKDNRDLNQGNANDVSAF